MFTLPGRWGVIRLPRRSEADAVCVADLQRLLLQGNYGLSDKPTCYRVAHNRYSRIAFFESITDNEHRRVAVKLPYPEEEDPRRQYQNLLAFNEINRGAFRTPTVLGYLLEVDAIVMSVVEGRTLADVLLSGSPNGVEACYWVGRTLRQFHTGVSVHSPSHHRDGMPQELLCRNHDDFHPGNVLIGEEPSLPGLIDPGPESGRIGLIYEDICKFLVALRSLDVRFQYPRASWHRYRAHALAFVEGYGPSYFRGDYASIWNSRLRHYVARRKREMTAILSERYNRLVALVGGEYLRIFFSTLLFPYERRAD